MPSTSPPWALTSVCRSSTAYASTWSVPSAASTAPRTSSPRSDTRASDRDARDPERRRAAADRCALAVLAADALPCLEVRTDDVDRAHHIDRSPDQVRPAHRGRDPASLDQVALRHPEHEVARRGIHLAPAEPAHVDPVRGV